MITYEIQELTPQGWKRFMNWWGMKKGYATGAFRMLVGFSMDRSFRLIGTDGEVIEQKRAPGVPEVSSGS